MKKTLAAAITSAIVIGAASTTFAAANPFSDVPTDHWSFDAVAKLAQEGVIEGYGDNTFRGDAHITRYEMAQMVAKAMAKDLSGADKATVDKLAAEYADELNNLGVRVANLEERSDNVKIKGLLRLDGKNIKDDPLDDRNKGLARLRLNIDAKVNDDWHVKGRLDGDTTIETSTSGDAKVKHAYAEGPLFGATSRFGKFSAFDGTKIAGESLMMDAEVTGAEFQFASNDNFKTTLTYGRLQNSAFNGNSSTMDFKMVTDGAFYTGAADYGSIQFGYDATDKFSVMAGYTLLKARDVDSAFGIGEDQNGIWQIAASYKFAPDWKFGAVYAQGDGEPEEIRANSPSEYLDDAEKKSYSFQFNYKGANTAVPQSYGLWLAYRQIGQMATIDPAYNGADYGTKGIEFGVNYAIDKNILTKLVYFDGKKITEDGAGNDNVKKLFGRVEFQF